MAGRSPGRRRSAGAPARRLRSRRRRIVATADRPRGAGALPAVGGFLLQVLAETLRWPTWALALSPYEHVQAVPYDTVNWAGTIAMTAIAAVLAVGGLLGFTRRDLRG